MRDGSFQIILAALLGLFYMLPTLIAYAREIPGRMMIAVFNVVLGWTVFGWIVMAIWAMSAPPEALVLLRVPPDELGRPGF